MRSCLATALILNFLASIVVAADEPRLLVNGLKNPASVCVGPKGLIYVTEIGERGKDGDGRVMVVQQGQARPFATGLNDPTGMAYYRDLLWIVDKNQIIQVDDQGRISVFAGPEKFPIKPRFLQDITIDGPSGIALISDAGESKSWRRRRLPFGYSPEFDRDGCRS